MNNGVGKMVRYYLGGGVAKEPQIVALRLSLSALGDQIPVIRAKIAELEAELESRSAAAR